MQLSITFRHMEASPAVKDYAEERLEKIKKYFSRDPIAAHGTFSVERNHNHTAEFSLTLPNGIVIQTRETTEDMYSSIDLSVARIERQVRKWKEKIRTHKPHSGPRLQVRQAVVAAENLEPQPGASADTKPAGEEIPVIRDATEEVRSLHVRDAAMQLNLVERDVLVFVDAERNTISVIYRRKDGNYGLLETGVSASPA
jgi:putative sigma-54 modulation protein